MNKTSIKSAFNIIISLIFSDEIHILFPDFNIIIFLHHEKQSYAIKDGSIARVTVITRTGSQGGNSELCKRT